MALQSVDSEQKTEGMWKFLVFVEDMCVLHIRISFPV